MQKKPISKKCWLDLKCVDKNMRGIIRFMNTHFGHDLTTISCCGGHKNHTEHQNKEGTCYIAFEGTHEAVDEFTKIIYNHIYSLRGDDFKRVFDRTKISMWYDNDTEGIAYHFEGCPDDWLWMEG